ncbi:MAG: TetR/AcrR family transcriptional regulator [Sutterellaceae bacterium]|nr:TetR/AcrR family transcriptional regulator [Sutterellaceae bacterium]
MHVFWRYGYETTSVATLCSELGVCPPSFYAAFESKEALFIEAIRYYEQKYWTTAFEQLEEASQPLGEAFLDFFTKAADLLVNPANPRGCMVVIAATNLSIKEERIASLMKAMRQGTRDVFKRRLESAKACGEFAGDPESTANALNIFLEGMSVQAKDGMSKKDLLLAVQKVPLLLALS